MKTLAMMITLATAFAPFGRADVYSGSVTDASTRQGLAGVAISIKGKPGTAATTDGQGEFTINSAAGLIPHSPSHGSSPNLSWNAYAHSFTWGPEAGRFRATLRDPRGRLLQSFSSDQGHEAALVRAPDGLLFLEVSGPGGSRVQRFMRMAGALSPVGPRAEAHALAKAARGAEPNTLVFEKAGYAPKEVPVDGNQTGLKVEMSAAAPFAGVLFKSAADRVKFNVEDGVADTGSNVKVAITGADLNVKFLKPNTETYGSTGAPQAQKQNNFVFDLGKEIDGTAYKSLKFRLKSNVALKVWVFCGKVPLTDPQVLTYLKPADGTTDFYSLPAGIDEEVELSLDSNFIGLDKARLRGITFRTSAGEGCPLERTCTTWPDMQMTLSNVRLEKTEVFKPRVKRLFAPPEGRKYLVIGQGIDGIDNFYAKNPVNRPAGIMGYLSTFDWNFGWGDWGGTQSGVDSRRIVLNPAFDGTVMQIGLGMWLSDASGNILRKGCKEIVEGKYDIYLDVVADRLKQMKRPVFLRLNHELDNPNHLCSSPENVGTEYAGAVKHVVERFHRRGVGNVSYVMHLWTWSNQQFWPEWFKMPFVEKYIDWIGVSSLVDGIDAGNINSIAGMTDKPVMIAEFARNGGATADWLGGAFQFVKNAPKLKMMCLINQNANFGPVKFTEFSGSQMAAYESGASDPAFLKQKDIKFRYTEMGGMEMSW